VGPDAGHTVAGIDVAADVAAGARAEVAALHQFFADWFNAVVDDTDEVFARVADVLHASFAMVVPSGEVLDRAAVLARLRAAHASADRNAPTRIEIRNVVNRVVDEDAALITYEEWRFEGDRAPSGRTSSAYFLRSTAAPNGVVWRHIHETSLRRD
jgi:hypothetical protein